MFFVLYGFDDWTPDSTLVGAVALAWTQHQVFIEEYYRDVVDICDYDLRILQYDIDSEEELVSTIQREITDANASYYPSKQSIYHSKLLFIPLKHKNDYLLIVSNEWGIAWGNIVESTEQIIQRRLYQPLLTLTILCKFLNRDIYDVIKRYLRGLTYIIYEINHTNIDVDNVDKLFDIAAIYKIELELSNRELNNVEIVRDCWLHKH